MEYSNGKPSSALTETVDPSGTRQGGVSPNQLEPLLQRGSIAPAGGGADIRTEVQQLRSELATAMASIRGLLADGDGNLHEMQLTSLRRQVSQLEGVLESNYQRELRVAEERETALRSEMAQMRQDLRVALETLYRMPSEADGAGGTVDLKPIKDQIAELGTSLARTASEQQAGILEREDALKSELASMRRDLLVTMEASYQLPTDRVEALDAQIASWRGQVEQLQSIVLHMHEVQEETSSRQQSALQEEMRQFRQEMQVALQSALPQSEHEEIASQRRMLTTLAERLEQQAAAADHQLTQLSEHVRTGSESLRSEIAELAADLHAVSPTAQDEQTRALLDERDRALTAKLEIFLLEVKGLNAAMPAPVPVDYSTDLQELRSTVQSLAGHVTGAREEQTSLLRSQVDLLREEIARSQHELEEASRAIAAGRSDGDTLSADTIGEMIGERLGTIQTQWSDAQTELYRQTVSQLAEIQADIDLMHTDMQALQTAEADTGGDYLPLLEEVRSLIQRPPVQVEASANAATTDDLNQILGEMRALRDDMTAALEARSTESTGEVVEYAPFPLDAVTQEIVARLHEERAENQKETAERDAQLQQELAQMRDDLQLAVLEALESPRPATGDNLVAEGIDPLVARVTDLEHAFQASQEAQRQWMAERDELLFSRLGELSSSLSSDLAEVREPHNDDDAWRSELSELRAEIARLAERSEPRDMRDDSAVIDLVASLRTEMLESLESIRHTQATPVMSESGSPALQDGLTALAVSLQQSAANQEHMVEVQQQALQAAIAQMREEIHAAVSGLTRESVDTFEKRQSQLRMDQAEMERNLARLRQELVATHSDPGNKKKLWR